AGFAVSCSSSSPDAGFGSGGGSTEKGSAVATSGAFMTVGAGGNVGGAISVMPASVTLDIANPGPAKTQAFKAYAMGNEVKATWTLDAAGLGSIDATGLFTTSGTHGGLVHVIAQVGKDMGQALVTVNLHVTENPGNVPPNVQGSLDGGGAA